MPLTFSEAIVRARAGEPVKPIPWPPGQYIVERKQPNGTYTLVREDGTPAQLTAQVGQPIAITSMPWELA